MLKESQEQNTNSNLEKLEALSSDAGMYMRLFCDSLEHYEQEETYKKKPELIEHCFPDGFDEDINEMISLLKKDLKNPKSKDEILNTLADLAESLKEERPVTYYAMEELFSYFGLDLDSKEMDSAQKKIRFRLVNRLFDMKEEEAFYKACGLEPELTRGKLAGKGSHVKWIDPTEEWKSYAVSSRSSKIWTKNDVRDLLKKGFPLDKLTKACRAFDLDFELI